MRYDQFLAKVRERGEYADTDQAEQVTRAVLGVLARRLQPGEVADLAAQLPRQLIPALPTDHDQVETFGVTEFLRRIAPATGATERTAQWDASAVLCTLAEAVSGGEINDVLSQLPSGFATLFGKASLSG